MVKMEDKFYYQGHLELWSLEDFCHNEKAMEIAGIRHFFLSSNNNSSDLELDYTEKMH